jgi:hypothetical protein
LALAGGTAVIEVNPGAALRRGRGVAAETAAGALPGLLQGCCRHPRD